MESQSGVHVEDKDHVSDETMVEELKFNLTAFIHLGYASKACRVYIYDETMWRIRMMSAKRIQEWFGD